MRRTLLTLIIVLGAVCGWAKKAVVWDNPALLSSSESYFRVKSVAFSDTATVVELLVINPQYNIRFESETFLRGDGDRRYMIRYCKEYPLDQWMPVEKKPETLLTLVFEPMPARQKAIDLLEGYGARNFKFYGIHDARKPLKIKPFPYDENAISDFRKSFFTTDSVCVRGRFEKIPADRVGIIYYTDVFTRKDCPIAVTVNDDGTFERKFKVEHPLVNDISFRNASVPFIVAPGHTVDITIRKNGSMEYTDENGNPSPFSRLLQSRALSHDTYGYDSSVADIKSMNFIDYGRKMERVADDAVRFTDYFAQRYSFSQLEYAVAKTAALLTSAVWFMKYDLEKQVWFSQTDSITKAHIKTPENYRVLRNKIFDERIALMHDSYNTLQNRYSFMSPILHILYQIREDGTYMEGDHATKDSLALALDRRIFGKDEPSLLMKVHLLNKLQQRIETGQNFSLSSEITEKEKADNEKDVYSDYLLTKSELTDSFFLVKADRMYQHYLDTRDFTYKLPQTKATQILQKITNQFKGRYVFLDFWSTSCGPCRANIEATEAIREELRKNPELAFIFITSDEESPEMVYNKYVEKHLKNDYTCRLPKDEYVLLRELFQFNGIPHYEILDKQGDVIRTDGHWDDMESFNYILNNIKKKLE